MSQLKADLSSLRGDGVLNGCPAGDVGNFANAEATACSLENPAQIPIGTSALSPHCPQGTAPVHGSQHASRSGDSHLAFPMGTDFTLLTNGNTEGPGMCILVSLLQPE